MKKLLPLWLVGFAILGSLGYVGLQRYKVEAVIEAKLKSTVTVRPVDRVECYRFTGGRSIVLLILGQSNAGNHGTGRYSGEPAIAIQKDGECALANDPLPGATGAGGSIWRGLPALLRQEAGNRLILLSIIALDDTTIDDWTRPHSQIAARLSSQVETLRRQGTPPNLVLWQQGEADAKIGTTQDQYLRGLQRLRALLDHAGTSAPLLIAKSTVCRTLPYAPVRSAIDRAVTGLTGFANGPDTDNLTGAAYRNDGCHFNANGLREAARAWGQALAIHVAAVSKPNVAGITR